MVLVPKVAHKYPDQCDFFIEDPGIKMSVDRSENVARSLKKNSWRTTLERCRGAASTLRGESATAADDWMSSLVRRAASQAAASKVEKEAAMTPQFWPAPKKWPGQPVGFTPAPKKRPL